MIRNGELGYLISFWKNRPKGLFFLQICPAVFNIFLLCVPRETALSSSTQG